MANVMLQRSVMAVVDQDQLPTRPDLVMKLTVDEGSCIGSIMFNIVVWTAREAHLRVCNSLSIS